MVLGLAAQHGGEHNLDSNTAGLLEELYLVPVVLGSGERLVVNVGDPKLEPVDVVATPAVTHINYRGGR